MFTKVVSEFLIKGLDNLCDTLQLFSPGHKKICGCIKNLYPSKNSTIKYDDASVVTFVRSSNTDSNRKSMDEKNSNQPIKISKNTDFKTIVNNEQTHNNDVFYKQNLLKYDKQLNKADSNNHYENTTDHYEQYYVATIVAPIRIANKRLFYKKEMTDYDLLGFLCVDTLDTHIFTEKRREMFTYLVKAYAATFYNMMSKYQYYLMKFDEYENANNMNEQESQKPIPKNLPGRNGRNHRKR